MRAQPLEVPLGPPRGIRDPVFRTLSHRWDPADRAVAGARTSGCAWSLLVVAGCSSLEVLPRLPPTGPGERTRGKCTLRRQSVKGRGPETPAIFGAEKYGVVVQEDSKSLSRTKPSAGRARDLHLTSVSHPAFALLGTSLAGAPCLQSVVNDLRE